MVFENLLIGKLNCASQKYDIDLTLHKYNRLIGKADQ